MTDEEIKLLKETNETVRTHEAIREEG